MDPRWSARAQHLCGRARKSGRIALRAGRYAVKVTALGVGLLAGAAIGEIGLVVGAQPDDKMGHVANWLAHALVANGNPPPPDLGIFGARMICEWISVAGWILCLLCLWRLFKLLDRAMDKIGRAIYAAKTP